MLFSTIKLFVICIPSHPICLMRLSNDQKGRGKPLSSVGHLFLAYTCLKQGKREAPLKCRPKFFGLHLSQTRKEGSLSKTKREAGDTHV